MQGSHMERDIVADCAGVRGPRQTSPGHPYTANHGESKSENYKKLHQHTDSGFFSGVLTEDLSVNNSQQNVNMRLLQTSDANTELADRFSGLKVKNNLNLPQKPVRQITLEDLVRQDEDGDTPLHLAVLQGFYEVSSRLINILSHPVLLDIPNNKQQTPLHLAVLTNQPALVRLLLVAGCSSESRDRNGNTPLHVACRDGFTDCARALCFPVSHQEREATPSARGSFPARVVQQNFEQRNYDGQMCVHLAAMCGNIPILQLLCWNGADVNATEAKSGRTALHYAVERRQSDLIHFLVTQCGARVDAETYSGYTAYQMAAAATPRLALLLLNLGAQRRPLVSTGSSDSDTDSTDEDIDDYVAKWRPHKGQYLEALGEALLLA